MATLEKAAVCSSVWNSSVERLPESDDTSPIVIRRIEWLAGQSSGDAGQGCLVVLLGAFGDSTDALKSVIVGLMPSAQQRMYCVVIAQ